MQHALDDAIAAIDAALARAPNDAALLARREALVAERERVRRGADAPELARRLADLEAQMSRPGADAKLVEEYERLREAHRAAVRLR